MASMVASWSGEVLMVPATENLKEARGSVVCRARDGAIGGAAVVVGIPKGRLTEGWVDAGFALDGGCPDLDPDPGKWVRVLLWTVGQILVLERRSGTVWDGLRRGGGGGIPDLVGGDGRPDSDPGRRLLFSGRKSGGGVVVRPQVLGKWCGGRDAMGGADFARWWNAVVRPVWTATLKGGCGVKGGGGVGRREGIRVGGEMGLSGLGPYGSLMEGFKFGLGKVLVGDGRPNKEKEGICLQVQETEAPALGE